MSQTNDTPDPSAPEKSDEASDPQSPPTKSTPLQNDPFELPLPTSPRFMTDPPIEHSFTLTVSGPRRASYTYTAFSPEGFREQTRHFWSAVSYRQKFYRMNYVDKPEGEELTPEEIYGIVETESVLARPQPENGLRWLEVKDLDERVDEAGAGRGVGEEEKEKPKGLMSKLGALLSPRKGKKV